MRCSIETGPRTSLTHGGIFGCSARKCAALLRHKAERLIRVAVAWGLQRAEVRCSIETAEGFDDEPGLFFGVAARGSALLY